MEDIFDILGGELPSVYRGQVVPPNALTDVEDSSSGVRLFPAFREARSHGIRAPPVFVVLNFPGDCPVILAEPFTGRVPHSSPAPVVVQTIFYRWYPVHIVDCATIPRLFLQFTPGIADHLFLLGRGRGRGVAVAGACGETCDRYQSERQRYRNESGNHSGSSCRVNT